METVRNRFVEGLGCTPMQFSGSRYSIWFSRRNTKASTSYFFGSRRCLLNLVTPFRFIADFTSTRNEVPSLLSARMSQAAFGDTLRKTSNPNRSRSTDTASSAVAPIDPILIDAKDSISPAAASASSREVKPVLRMRLPSTWTSIPHVNSCLRDDHACPIPFSRLINFIKGIINLCRSD